MDLTAPIDPVDPIDPVTAAVDDLYKSHYGKIVSALLTSFSDTTLESAEDAVQDAFTKALTGWTAATIPDNPAGWIYTVSRNGLISGLRSASRFSAPIEPGDRAIPDFSGSLFKDQQLRLLFACAHPDLSPKVQIVITLKYVANLKIDAIAKALGMTTDGIDKLLLRARKKVRDDGLFLLDPGNPAGLRHRLPTVHKIIYLIFNEGYKPTSGTDAVNESLCEEALLLCKDLLDHELADNATVALYALMLFNAARFNGRTGSSGELIDLDQQDRSQWNRPMIALACDYFRASRGSRLTPYHFEAAIAWLHCSADSFRETNWRLISRLYLRLLRMNPNPFVELNYAIALYFAGGKDKAFEVMHGLLQQPFMNGYYLLNAALGKLYLLDGDHTRAKKYLERTLEQTEHPLEIAFIRRLLENVH
ncbi:MAG TPA: sigma-70 family RNA polymerase sigma factor [Puia sp.]|nr:sigma-70 family RNA polymerase sigma factor [Puia sp.]